MLPTDDWLQSARMIAHTMSSAANTCMSGIPSPFTCRPDSGMNDGVFVQQSGPYSGRWLTVELPVVSQQECRLWSEHLRSPEYGWDEVGGASAQSPHRVALASHGACLGPAEPAVGPMPQRTTLMNGRP